MIHEFEFYHGAVLTKIAHHKAHTAIRTFNGKSNASYVINDNIGLYVKHSSNRLTPWGFSFAREHQKEIEAMREKFDDVFVALVCGKDGVACLSFDELKHVLDHEHDDYAWVRISRRPREKYSVKGTDGKLMFKIGQNEFPAKLFEKQANKDKKFKFGW